MDRFLIVMQRSFGNIKDWNNPDETRKRIDEAFEAVEVRMEEKQLNNNERILVRRKLFLAHVINSPLFTSLSSQEQDFPLWDSLRDLFSLNNEKVLFQMIKVQNLWTFLFELILFSPSPELIVLILTQIEEHFESVIDDQEGLSVLLGLMISFMFCPKTNRPHQDLRPLCEKVQDKIYRAMLSKLDDSQSFVISLLILKFSTCSFETVTYALLGDLNELDKEFYPSNQEPRDVCLSQNLRVSLEKEIEKRLSLLTVDKWMDYAEKETKTFLDEVRPLKLWPSDEIFPSNLQLFISHLAFEVIDCIVNSQVKNKLGTLAKKYHPKVEVNAEDHSFEQLMEKAKDHDLDLWKKQIIIEHLVKEELEQLLFSEEGRHIIRLLPKDIFTSQPQILSKICDIYFSNTTVVEILELFLELFGAESTSVEEKKKILFKRLEGQNLKEMRGKNYDQQLRQLFNQMVQSEDANKEVSMTTLLLCVAFQDPANLLSSCVGEAIQSPGKIVTISSFLEECPELTKYKDEENGYLLTSIVVTNFNQISESEKGLWNLTKIAQNLLKNEPMLAKDLVKFLVNSDKRDNLENCLFMADNLLDTRDLIFLPSAEEDLAIVSKLVHLAYLHQEVNDGPVRGKVVQMLIKIANSSDSEMKSMIAHVVPIQIRSFFTDQSQCRSFGDILNYFYAQKHSANDLECEWPNSIDFKITPLLLCQTLPMLLPDQWDILPELHLAKFESAQEKVTLVTEALEILYLTDSITKNVKIGFVQFLQKIFATDTLENSLDILKKVVKISDLFSDDMIEDIMNVVSQCVLDLTNFPDALDLLTTLTFVSSPVNSKWLFVALMDKMFQ